MYNYYSYSQFQQGLSYARIFHASPDAPAVDVYVNGQLVAPNLSFGNFTEYLPLPPGNYNVKVYGAGTRTNPVIDEELKVPPRGIYTIAAINKLENIELYPILDKSMPIPSGKVYLRFVHLSPGAPNVDIRLPDGKNVFKDVEYKEVTDYALVNPGTYTFNVYPTGTDKSVLYVPNVTLKANRFYTVYAIGEVEGRNPLQVVIPLDGNSYLKV